MGGLPKQVRVLWSITKAKYEKRMEIGLEMTGFDPLAARWSLPRVCSADPSSELNLREYSYRREYSYQGKWSEPAYGFLRLCLMILFP